MSLADTRIYNHLGDCDICRDHRHCYHTRLHPYSVELHRQCIPLSGGLGLVTVKFFKYFKTRVPYHNQSDKYTSKSQLYWRTSTHHKELFFGFIIFRRTKQKLNLFKPKADSRHSSTSEQILWDCRVYPLRHSHQYDFTPPTSVIHFAPWHGVSFLQASYLWFDLSCVSGLTHSIPYLSGIKP